MSTTFDNDLQWHQAVANLFIFTEVDMPFVIDIRNTFLALPTAALSMLRIAHIACAIRGVDFRLERADEVQATLTLLVRKGVLRSRTDGVGGIRLYEANY